MTFWETASIVVAVPVILIGCAFSGTLLALRFDLWLDKWLDKRGEK